MTRQPGLDQAHAAFDAAAAEVQYAEVHAALSMRRGLHYAAVDPTRARYLVAFNGQILGELRHDRANGALDGWTAHPAGTDRKLGPFRTGRQAAAELRGRRDAPALDAVTGR